MRKIEEFYDWGYTLGLKGETILAKGVNKTKRLSPESRLILSGIGSLSSEVFWKIKESQGELMLEKGQLELYYFGRPSNKLVLNQIKAYLDVEVCSRIATSILRAAALNKLKVLEVLNVPRIVFEESKRRVEALLETLSGTSLSRLMGVEAAMSKVYYNALRSIIPVEYGFTARTRRPPEDCFSAALSFGNMILYRVIVKQIIKRGLDPRIGFLHIPFRDRPSLALDIAEEFRQFIVDVAVVPLFTSKSMSLNKDFKRKDSGVFLSKSGRAKTSKVIHHRLNLKTSSGKVLDLIDTQVKKLIEFLEGKANYYEPFTKESYLER